MKRTDKIRKRICIILAALIFATSFIFLPAQDTRAAGTSVLFVGNSRTYYNNVPEIFKNISAAGGVNVNVYGAVYSGRTLAVHAGAIAAVARTKGQAYRLTAAEKEYFRNKRTDEYDKDVFDKYCEFFWDYGKGKARHYDIIILQIKYNSGEGDGSVESIYNSLSSIIKARNDPNTTYVVNVTSEYFNSTKADLAAVQKRIDYLADTAISYIRNTPALRKKYYNIWAAYTGRAICNYLYYTGDNIAINREPGAYSVLYRYYNQPGCINDMFNGDRIHYTILGSYLVAATLYSSIFGYAWYTAPYYSGGSSSILPNICGSMNPQYNKYYNGGQGFTDPTIPRQITYIADVTTYYGMRLTSVSSARKWKNNSNMPQYDYMNCKAVVTFDGNGADINTFGQQTYYYGKSGYYLEGTIERKGYKMLGWALTKKAKKASYSINSKVTNKWISAVYKKANGKVTLYAVWEKIEEETEEETTAPEEETTGDEPPTGEEPVTEPGSDPAGEDNTDEQESSVPDKEEDQDAEIPADEIPADREEETTAEYTEPPYMAPDEQQDISNGPSETDTVTEPEADGVETGAEEEENTGA